MSESWPAHQHESRTETQAGMEKVTANLEAVIAELSTHPDVIQFQKRLHSDEAEGPELIAVEQGDVVAAYNHARDALNLLKKSSK